MKCHRMWLGTSGVSADRQKKHRMLKAASGGTAQASSAIRCHPADHSSRFHAAARTNNTHEYNVGKDG
ncbi:MAG TPA: hypothetical protein PK308_05905, partial [Phycisphaerales bacterium]|nr:hypothetical protein [Phycisphaerales bacterium]